METIKKTAIVILTFNNLGYSQECVQSIRENTQKGTYEIIVVDNASTDGTKEWLQGQADIKLHLNQANEGFPKGCNTGIKMADPDSDILLLKNAFTAASGSARQARSATITKTCNGEALIMATSSK
jgi:GT2 family glycosyltransferase